eukprot:1035210-Amphidinium_carterae.1
MASLSALILRAVMSCLRHKHMAWASLLTEATTPRFFVHLVSKGKVKGGAPFRVALLAYLGGQQPVFKVLQQILDDQLGKTSSLREDDRNALGNWLDHVGGSRKSEPMDVGYSDTHLDRCANVKPSILAALHHAFLHVPEANHGLVLPLGVHNVPANVPVPSPLGRWPPSSMLSKPPAIDLIRPLLQDIECILPKGSRSLLHVMHPDLEGAPLCKSAAFAWGFTVGK